MNKRETGFGWEAVAQNHLQQAGLTLVQKNYQCLMGEIDLIMQASADEWVFVEVRYRHSDDYGDGSASVTPQKQARIIRAASLYLLERELFDKVHCRFDVVSIGSEAPGTTIEWIKDAFQTRPLS
jgi:putative endonuclease